MLRLAILRHAKAAPLAGGGDHARPLALRGLQDSPRLAAFMVAQGVLPDLALVSDARRTRETFDVLAAHLIEKPSMRLEQRIYEASFGALLTLVQAVPESVRTLLLIGHNPGMAELALRLTGYGDRYAASRMRAKFPTCGLAILDFDMATWADIAPGLGRLDCFMIPADLGGQDE